MTTLPRTVQYFVIPPPAHSYTADALPEQDYPAIVCVYTLSKAVLQYDAADTFCDENLNGEWGWRPERTMNLIGMAGSSGCRCEPERKVDLPSNPLGNHWDYVAVAPTEREARAECALWVSRLDEELSVVLAARARREAERELRIAHWYTGE